MVLVGFAPLFEYYIDMNTWHFPSFSKRGNGVDGSTAENLLGENFCIFGRIGGSAGPLLPRLRWNALETWA